MKVYYVGTGLEGCYNVRCLFPLQENGWNGDRTTFMLNKSTPEDKAKASLDADIVVFHRPLGKDILELARILKSQGKKVVMDNDDTLKDDNGFKFNEFMDEKRVKKGMEKMNRALDTFAAEADMVTCTTEFLKKEYEKVNKNVEVLPNCVDPFYYPEPIENDTDVIRIGMTGSVGVTNDIEACKPIIKHYENDPRVKLVLLSVPPKGQNDIYKELYSEQYAYWSSVNIEWHPFAKVDEYYKVLNELKLDMVIIPRADTYFNRCKSNLKFLENSMLEIPTVAQSFLTNDSPYEVNKEDAKHLLLAGNSDEFIEKIELLIADKELRKKMGKEAHEYVLKNYTIEDNAHLWEEAYNKLNK
ncbi:MAG TPA: glycosyltransferase family 1 protein [Candidatus Bathyarchaeota archaeon]|nr:glycosyltransferase family 1 protein [Candidatus Bathyarchaeota archaeon]